MKKAVALKYTPGESEAPIVVAKGSGRIADSILEKAKEHGVPVQEDAALVEVLSKLGLGEPRNQDHVLQQSISYTLIDK
ncbi:EscU/YscU/HrcU family type III secretion system export apparatus switch protein [Paenibacillus sp. Mc5Re-14]|uniref:EscU/YscU/HrcU family type III secretion system export apparatus switch protein n=1 Tax=Paenibacillus sp. Mc5Re-14 TaxID=1030529 RepID=UPI000B82F902|nr:EscU/YscU/HrcU family type III secretion system export apparatus switch protein [Paenibacillus sp. Mc5Re-14]